MYSSQTQLSVSLWKRPLWGQQVIYMTERKLLMSVRLCMFTGYHIILKLNKYQTAIKLSLFYLFILTEMASEREWEWKCNTHSLFIEAAVGGEIGM